MRTINRLAILAAIAAAPFLALAAPAAAKSGAHHESQEGKSACQRACSCQVKSSAKADAAQGPAVDFFKAGANNPVP